MLKGNVPKRLGMPGNRTWVQSVVNRLLTYRILILWTALALNLYFLERNLQVDVNSLMRRTSDNEIMLDKFRFRKQIDKKLVWKGWQFHHRSKLTEESVKHGLDSSVNVGGLIQIGVASHGALDLMLGTLFLRWYIGLASNDTLQDNMVILIIVLCSRCPSWSHFLLRSSVTLVYVCYLSHGMACCLGHVILQ